VILVTGGTGHVGRHLVDALVKNGENVRVFAKDTKYERNDVDFVCGDLLDEDIVMKAVHGADVIYHLAAIVDYVPAPDKLMYDVNVVGTQNMLKHSNAKKFVYLSSTSVYGKRHENPANENTRLNPSSYYGKTKVIAEKMVLEKGGVSIRSPVIYGPGFNEGFYTIIGQIQKGTMRIIGNGKNRMQWIHVSDLIDALLLAKEKGKNGEVYLIAGKEVMTQEELLGLVAECLGVQKPVKHVSTNAAYALAYYKMFSAKLMRKKPKLIPGHISSIVADRTFDTSKAKSELGFEAKVDYKQGIMEMVGEFKGSVSE
jgi:nucleoside-diphosphate-sugar epimerase